MGESGGKRRRATKTRSGCGREGGRRELVKISMACRTAVLSLPSVARLASSQKAVRRLRGYVRGCTGARGRHGLDQRTVRRKRVDGQRGGCLSACCSARTRTRRERGTQGCAAGRRCLVQSPAMVARIGRHDIRRRAKPAPVSRVAAATWPSATRRVLALIPGAEPGRKGGGERRACPCVRPP